MAAPAPEANGTVVHHPETDAAEAPDSEVAPADPGLDAALANLSALAQPSGLEEEPAGIVADDATLDEAEAVAPPDAAPEPAVVGWPGDGSERQRRPLTRVSLPPRPSRRTPTTCRRESQPPLAVPTRMPTRATTPARPRAPEIAWADAGRNEAAPLTALAVAAAAEDAAEGTDGDDGTDHERSEDAGFAELVDAGAARTGMAAAEPGGPGAQAPDGGALELDGEAPELDADAEVIDLDAAAREVDDDDGDEPAVGAEKPTPRPVAGIRRLPPCGPELFFGRQAELERLVAAFGSLRASGELGERAAARFGAADSERAPGRGGVAEGRRHRHDDHDHGDGDAGHGGHRRRERGGQERPGRAPCCHPRRRGRHRLVGPRWFPGAGHGRPAALAVAIGLEGTDTGSLVANVADWLAATDDRWLLVVDGVERWDDIADLLPSSGNGQLVVTGHQVPAEARDTAVLLRPFSPGEGADYLRAHRRHADAGRAGDGADRLTGPGDDEPQDALERLSTALDGQPWALTLAARHLALAEELGADDLLAELAAPPHVEGLHGGPSPADLDLGAIDAVPSIDLEDEVPPADAMVLVAVNELALTSPTAAAAMTAAAALAAAPLRGADLDQLSDSERTVTDLGHARGLVETGADLVEMPGPVRDALRRRWTAAAAERSVGFTLELLDQQVSGNASASEADLYAPHVLQVLAGAAARGLRTGGTARLAGVGSDWLRRMGDLDAALALARTGAQTAERVLGPDDPVTHGARLALADLYVELGDHAAALGVQAQVVADHERALGPDDPLTLHARANLAADHLLVGDFALAIVEGERAVDGLAAHYGPDHPETMAAHDVLEASWAAEQAAAQAAASDQTDERAGLAADAAPGQPTDPATTALLGAAGPAAGSWVSAGVPIAMGAADADLDTAALTDLLAQQTASLGEVHPETLETLHRLGTAHSDSGAYPAAIDAFERLVDASAEVYGHDDLRTLTARNDLANAYATAGQHDRALQMLEEVVDGAVRGPRPLQPRQPHRQAQPGQQLRRPRPPRGGTGTAGGGPAGARNRCSGRTTPRRSAPATTWPTATPTSAVRRRPSCCGSRSSPTADHPGRRPPPDARRPQQPGQQLRRPRPPRGGAGAPRGGAEDTGPRPRPRPPPHPHAPATTWPTATPPSAATRRPSACGSRPWPTASGSSARTTPTPSPPATTWPAAGPSPSAGRPAPGTGGLVTASASATTTAPLPDLGPGWPAPEAAANGSVEANGHREVGGKRRRFWFFWRR